MAACAAFRKESRMKFVNATNLDRKSGVELDIGSVSLIGSARQRSLDDGFSSVIILAPYLNYGSQPARRESPSLLNRFGTA
jgi:hypothetical protein